MIFNQTILWMGMSTLIASLLGLAVLLLRPKLASVIGARGVVLLWSIPALRLLMPPLPQQTVAPTSTLDQPVHHVLAGPVVYGEPAVMEAAVSAQTLSIDWSVLGLIALMVWALGTLLYFGRIALATARFHQALSLTRSPVPQSVTRLAKKTALEAGLSKTPHIIMSDAVETPQVTGFFRPLVVLPVSFHHTYSLYEQRHALMHEFIHVKRGDLMTAWIAMALTALQWFNPLAHRCLQAFRIDQEAACDEAVRAVGIDPADYAATLVKSVRLGTDTAPALSLNHGLRERLKRMGRPVPPSPLIKGASILIVTTAIASAVSTAGSYAVQPPKTSDLEAALEGEDAGVTLTKADKPRKTALSGHYTVHTDDGKIFIQRDGKDVKMLDLSEGIKPTNVMVQNNNGRLTIDITDEDGNERHHEFDIGDTVEKSMVFISKPEGGFYHHGDHRYSRNQRLYLVGNPFEGIEPPQNPALEKAMKNMPEPPEPPEPPKASKPKKVEGGQWVFVPDPPDMTEFEMEMNKFEFRMGSFSADMEAFGAEMEKFGQRMERIGETIETLSDDCDSHLEESSSIKLLRRNNPEARGQIKALCIPTGDARPDDETIVRFIKRQRSLHAEEKTALINEGHWNKRDR